jgi:hypothetical protein
VSGGSGVLAGSIADTAQGSAERKLTRQLSGGVFFGYAHNTGLNGLSTTNPAIQSYSYWFGGANFTRTFGRALEFNANYLLQHQTSNAAFCVGPTCNTDLVRQQISFGVTWQRQPIPF